MTKDRDILKELFEVSLSALSFDNISIYNDLLLEVFQTVTCGAKRLECEILGSAWQVSDLDTGGRLPCSA